MKKIIKIFLIGFLFILSGCAKSIINLVLQDDKQAITMFGKNPSRNFFYNITMSDSLKLVWDNSTYGSFNNSAPVVYDSIIFIGDLGGRVYCFDSRTGKQKGLLRTKGSIFSSPIVQKNKIIYALCEANSNNTYLVYYDFLNSAEQASIVIDGLVLNQIISDKDDIILCTENGKIQKYSPEGKLKWGIETKNKILCNPALAGNKIVVGNINGEVLWINSESGELILRKKIGNSFLSGVTIDNNIVFIGDNDGILYALNIDDGKMIWKFKTNARILMNSAADNEKVYVGNLDGELYSLDKTNGKLIWKLEVGGVLNSTPLITKNRLVINNLNESFYLINTINGKISKRYPLDGRGKLSPILVNNKLIIGYDDGNLNAYEIIN
jgi:outer membrane protein assembly factor BamB